MARPIAVWPPSEGGAARQRERPLAQRGHRRRGRVGERLWRRGEVRWQLIKIIEEGRLAKVEVDGRVRIDANDRVERERGGLRGVCDAEERAVVRVEDLPRGKAVAAADGVAGAEARPKGGGARSGVVKDPPVVRVVPVRVRVPPGLPAGERELGGREAHRDAVHLRLHGTRAGRGGARGGAEGDLVVGNAARSNEPQPLAAAAAARPRPPQRVERRPWQRRLTSDRTVATEAVADVTHAETVGGDLKPMDTATATRSRCTAAPTTSARGRYEMLDLGQRRG